MRCMHVTFAACKIKWLKVYPAMEFLSRAFVLMRARSVGLGPVLRRACLDAQDSNLQDWQTGEFRLRSKLRMRIWQSYLAVLQSEPLARNIFGHRGAYVRWDKKSISGRKKRASPPDRSSNFQDRVASKQALRMVGLGLFALNLARNSCILANGTSKSQLF